MMERVAPAPAAGEHELRDVDAELTWLWARLVHHLRQGQLRGRFPPPSARFFGVAISGDEVEALLGQAAAPEGALAAAAAEAERELHEQEVMRSRRSAEVPPTLWHLRSRFRLADVEYLVLLLGLGHEVDARFARMYGYLQDHFERQYPTLALALELAACHEALGQPRVAVRRLVEADGALFRHSLMRMDAPKQGEGAIHRALVLDERIVRYALGNSGLDPRLEAWTTLHRVGDAEATPLCLGPEARSQWDHLAAHLRRLYSTPGPSVVAMVGPEGAGRTRWVREAVRPLGLGTLRASLALVPPGEGSAARFVAHLAREARLQGCVLVLDGWEELLLAGRSAEAAPDGLRGADAAESVGRVLWETLLAAASGDAGEPVVVLLRSVASVRPAWPCPTVTVHVPAVTAGEREVLWSAHLDAAGVDVNADVSAVAGAFRITPGHIEQAVTLCVQSSSPAEPIDERMVSRAVRDVQKHRLMDSAILVERSYQWKDLVVPAEVEVQLRELIGRYRHRETVVQTWGIGRRFGADLGLSALFEGPPGTGKTMSASLVAQELGLDLFQIDLSRVVDRYVGETEKKLARLFDEAERARAVLLFDEADSLFSTRTAVQSANDRYANLEVNFLLQRLESFSGIAILTTNFPEALDAAFTRRLSLRITFPKPSAPERARLWRSMLDLPSLPRAAIDPAALGQAFELTGGHIRNAVLRAAFLAAERRQPVDQRLLQLAAQIEMKDQGMLVQGSPLAALWDLQEQ